MKRKVFTAVIAAVLMAVLLATSALAAWALLRSDEAEAVQTARKALGEEYGLTAETLGLFATQSESEGDVWTVTFRPAGLHPALLGSYTVTQKKGEAPEATWTYDDVDPQTWQGGDMESRVWGQPQLLWALHNYAEASAIIQAMDLPEAAHAPAFTPPPNLREDESFWQGQILREGAPGPEDIPEADALSLAKAALLEDTNLRPETLDGAYVLVDFSERDEGNPLWGFDFHVEQDGVAMGCGVMLDARTGEILLTNVVAGANE